MNWLALLSLIINLVAGILTYRTHPVWSGTCFGVVLWCASEIFKSLLPHPREKLSTSTLNYQYGWADGWNACRDAKPEDRIFKRTDTIGR